MNEHYRNNFSSRTYNNISPEKKNEKLPSNISYGKLLSNSESRTVGDRVDDSIDSNEPDALTNHDINNYLLNCASTSKVSEPKFPENSRLYPFKVDLTNSTDRLYSNCSIENMNGNNNLHSNSDQGKYPRNNMVTKPSQSSPSPYCTSVNNRDSPSPHASNASLNQSSPLYENVDFYNGGQTSSQTPTYYHQRPRPSSHSSGGSQDSRHSSPRTSIVSCESSSALYESTYRKAQPQVPVSYPKYIPPMGKDLPPYEAPPVYETLAETSKNENSYEPAKPGPQVPTQASDQLSRYPAQHATPYINPVPTTVPQGVKALSEYNAPIIPRNMRGYNSANNLSYFQDSDIPTTTIKLSQMCVVGQPALAASRAHKQPNPLPKKLQAATAYKQESPIYNNVLVQTSPTPPLPFKTKQPVKNLLPYNVTPPRPMVILSIICIIICFNT